MFPSATCAGLPSFGRVRSILATTTQLVLFHLPLHPVFGWSCWTDSVVFEGEAVVPCNDARMGRIAERVIMTERWLSVDEIAAHLGVNPDTIYKWISRKGLPAHKAGKLWKFLATEVDQWVKRDSAARAEKRKSDAPRKSTKA